MSQILIDVRTKEEYKSKHAEGAINIPIEQIIKGDLGEISKIKKDEDIGCYCMAGGRAGVATKILKGLGYVNAKNLGGLKDIN